MSRDPFGRAERLGFAQAQRRDQRIVVRQVETVRVLQRQRDRRLRPHLQVRLMEELLIGEYYRG